MRIIVVIVSLLLFSLAEAQDNSIIDSSSSSKIADPKGFPVSIRGFKKGVYDTVHAPGHNMYGDLLNDDPEYNPKYPWWKPALGVVETNIFSWAVNRYIFKYDWARISLTTWKNNIREGWEWDNDRFG